jgi:site-specific recombinase XerD
MIRLNETPAIRKISMVLMIGLDVTSFIETMKHKNLAPSTNNRPLLLIHYAYKIAHKWSEPYLSLNSINGVRYLKDDDRMERYLSADESSQLLQSLQPSYTQCLQ